MLRLRLGWFASFVFTSILLLTSGTARATNYTYTALAATCPLPPGQCGTFVPGNPENWGDARNWSPQGVPGAGDTATIAIGQTVDLGGVTRSVLRLTLNNGTQFGTTLKNGTLTITGASSTYISTWTSGNIACTLNIAAGTRLNISGNIGRALVGATVNNSGAVVWTGEGFISCVNSPTFNNKSGGVFTAQSDSSWSPNVGTTAFNNQAGAVFNRSGAGTKTTFQSVNFNNAGTVNGLSGTLDLVICGGNSSGLFTAANGARVNVSGTFSGTFNAASTGVIGIQDATLNTGAKFIGAGKSQAFSGTVKVNGTITTGETGGPGTLEIANTDFCYFTGTASSNLTSAGTGFYDWVSGDVGTGSGTGANSGEVLNIASSGVLKISGNANKAFYGATINNSGVVTWQDGGGVSCVNSPIFNNKSGGVFNAQSDSSWAPNTGVTVFNNQAGATVNKSGAGTKTTFQGVDFNNAGTVNGLSGTLDFVICGGNSNGLFTAADGARVNVSGTFSGTFNAASTGVIGIQDATLNTGTKIIGAGKSQAFSGTVKVNGTITTGETGGPGTLEIAMTDFSYFTGTPSGSLTSAGTGYYDWKSGDVGTGSGTGANSGEVLNIASSGVFKISGNGNKAFYGAVINNSGVVIWQDEGGVSCVNSPIFNNKSGGIFNAQSTSSWAPNTGVTVFNNQAGATVNRSGAGTTTTFQFVDFNNTGAVNGLSGTLDLVFSSGTSTGLFTAANGARVNVSGDVTGTLNAASGGVVGIQDATLGTGTKIIGAGKSQVFSGTTRVTGTITTGEAGGPGTLELALGAFSYFTGTASSNLASVGTGFYDWVSGDVGTGSGTGAGSGEVLNIAPSGVFRISGNGSKAFYGAVINNNGRVDWLDESGVSCVNSPIFNNKSGGVFNAQSNASWAPNQGVTIFENQTGATVNKSGAGTKSLFQSVDFNNAGIVNVVSGTLEFSDVLDQSAGAVVLKGGELSVQSGLSMQGGTLSGNGTVTGNITNNGGSVSPGLSAPGALLDSGSFAQKAGGDLRIQLNGSTAVTQYDQFNVNGTVALNGTLTLSANFAPPTGTSFTIIDNDGADAVTGTFSGLPQGASVSAGNALMRINYNGGDGNDVVLTSINPTLAISDSSISEGNGGTKNLNFTVTLSEALNQPVTVQYATTDNTASSPADFTEVPPTTLTFNSGQVIKVVTVVVQGDTLDEENETFFVDLKNATGAKIADNRGIGTINDDDAPPKLSIADATPVGESAGNALFTVSLSAASGKTVTVKYATANGSAAAPGDYTAANGTLTFAPGETSKTVGVAIKNDLLDESDETFTVNLNAAVNAIVLDGQATGTILDDDGPAIIINNPSTVVEGPAQGAPGGTVNAVFSVTLSAASLQTVTVQYATADFTATAGEDYVAQSGTLTFAPGETSKTIVVAVNGDTIAEGNEVFLVNLSRASNSNIADSVGAVLILDDDVAALFEDAPSE